MANVAPPVPVVVIMGRKDETVPFALVEETWRSWKSAGLAAGSEFIELAECDHSLVSEADLITTQIRRVAGGVSSASPKHRKE